MEPEEYEKLVLAAEREGRIMQIGQKAGCGLTLEATLVIVLFTRDMLRLGLVCGAWFILPFVAMVISHKDKAFRSLQKESYQMAHASVVGENELKCIHIRMESMRRGFRVKPARKYVLKMMEKMEPKCERGL